MTLLLERKVDATLGYDVCIHYYYANKLETE